MKTRIIFLAFAFLISCIEPITVTTGIGGALVVDGWIFDQPGPYTVKLSRTIPYDNTKPLKVYSIPEPKAQVTISDDQGNSEILIESSPGVYTSQSLQGVAGRSYQLKIKTATGRSYSSTIEKMPAAPAIAAIAAKYQVGETLFINANGDARVAKKESFGIYVTVNDPAVEKNFYRWEASGVFEFFSVTDAAAEKQCWAPSPGRLETNLQVMSDLNFDGQPYSQFLGTFPYDRPTKYLLHVRQESLTEAGYNFYKKISNQQTSTGTLFDPPPTPIAGNVYNEQDDTEIVLGFFGASSVTEKDLLADRFALAGKIGPANYILPKPGFCRLQEPGATNILWPGF